MSRASVQTKSPLTRGAVRQNDAWRAAAVCGFLVLAVLLAFGRTFSQGFSNIDDFVFVYDQPHVKAGLSWAGVVWAFTSGPAGEWYPLSMLSHMLDCQLFGLNPAGHHATNVLLHAAAAVSLFLVLWRMTAQLWASALVAALFALHPLRVESVAWIAERRDVLSGLFFMFTLGAYGEYVRRPRSLVRYLVLVVCFVLGLLAKPMLVTVPPLLLLLDFWPLDRFADLRPNAAATKRQRSSAPTARSAAIPWRIILEKVPLMVLALAAAGMTLLTHNPWLIRLSMPERLANAAVACVAYLGQLFVPIGLSPFYSYPETGLPAWQVAGAAALLLAITAAAVIGRRAFPYLFVGWFWYLGMLAPVLGLTVVGMHARADRYTYLPQIGLYLALVWGAMRLGRTWPARRWVFGVGSAVALAALMICTWRQTGYWHDPVSLWEHAVACDPQAATAHYNLARALSETDPPRAVAEYQLASIAGPQQQAIYNMIRSKAQVGLGDVAARQGNIDAAMQHYQQALNWDADSASSVTAHMNLAGLLAAQGNYAAADVHFQRSIELARDNPAIYCNVAVALGQQGKTDEAIAYCRQALKIDPNLGIAHSNLGALLMQRGDSDGAIEQFRQAIKNDPNVAFSYQQIVPLLRGQGRMSEAAKYDKLGEKVRRDQAARQTQQGIELLRQGNTAAATALFQAAIASAADFAPAHNGLADALAAQGDVDGAIAQYRQTLAIDPNFAPARQSLDQLSRP